MSNHSRKFTASELTQIDKADDLHISPLRDDERTYGTPTWIWAVIVDGELYVRAYNGVKSSWHKAALRQKAGRIKAAGMIKQVGFESIEDSGLNQSIDEAYQKKYNGSPYVDHMIGNSAKSATIKILPV